MNNKFIKQLLDICLVILSIVVLLYVGVISIENTPKTLDGISTFTSPISLTGQIITILLVILLFFIFIFFIPNSDNHNPIN